MNLQKIEDLITKFEKGDTSLEEEKILMDFFCNEEVPFQLRSYKDLFDFMDTSKDEELINPDFDSRVLDAMSDITPISKFPSRRIKLYSALAVAASIVILIGLYFQFGQMNQVKDTYDDPLLAYAETKRILMKVSGNLNSGVDELKNVSEFNSGMEHLNKISSFDDGMQNLEKISMLEKSKEIITSKNNKNEKTKI